MCSNKDCALGHPQLVQLPNRPVQRAKHRRHPPEADRPPTVSTLVSLTRVIHYPISD